MFNQYKLKYLKGGRGGARYSALAKVSLTVVAIAMLWLVANAWYAPQNWKLFGSKTNVAIKTINFTPIEASVCQGASQAVNITITEDDIDDFQEGSEVSTLVLKLVGSNDFSFDVTQAPNVVISGGSSEGTNPNPQFVDGKLTFDYKFTMGSTTNANKNSIIITNLYVKATSDAAQDASATISVESGADFIDGLDNATDDDKNNGSVLANIGLHDILSNIGKITGNATISEGEVATFSVPEVINAAKYVWNVPAELNGGQAGVIETDLPEIKLQAEQVETSIPVVNLKVKARNDNCETEFSDDHPIMIQAVGLSIVSDPKVICRTTEKRPLNKITIEENSLNDFEGKGQLVLAFSDMTNFSLKGAPALKVNDKDDEVGFKIERKNNTLVIDYDFTPTAFGSSLDKLEITGVEVKPQNDAPASTVALRPQSVDNLQWKGVYNNTDFATLMMREIPSKANGIEVYHLGNDQMRIVALGINNATKYEWILPIGVAVKTTDLGKETTELTNTSDITVQYDNTISDLSTLSVTVKGKDGGCDGEVSDAEPLVDAIDAGVKVNFQTIEGLCINGEVAVLPEDIVCTELDNAVFREGEIRVELPTGFKLVVKPKVYFGEEDKTPQEITSVAYTTNQQGISFSLAGLENKSQKNQLTIRGVVVQAVEATSSNQEVLLQAVGLFSKTLSFARLSRYEVTPTPELLETPPLLCKNTTDLTFSVKPVANMTYRWDFPTGVTIISPSKTTSRVTVTLGSNFKGGELTITTIPNSAHSNACVSASTTHMLVTPDVPSPAVIIIQGKDDFFVGDQVTFEALGAQNVHEYEWTIPNGLKHASNQTLVRTSSPQIVLEAISEVSNAEVKVVAVNECDVASTSLTKKVNTTLSKPVLVPLTLNTLCPGAENVPVTLTLEEVFKQDFKGKGVVTFTPEGSNFSLIDQASVSLKVKENATELTGNGFSAKVENNKLTVTYDFTNGDDYSKINKLVIEDVPMKLSNDIEAPASLSLDALVAPDGGQPMMELNKSNIFVNIEKLIAFNTESTTIKLYEGDGTNTTNPLNTLCANATNKQYTFKVSGITGANKYIWGVPTDVFENIEPTGDLVKVTLKDNPTVGSDNNVSITVQGERTGSECQSAIVSQTIQVFTNFEADTEVGFDNAISSLCKIDGEIKSLEVKEISGATHYQWTLPAEMETITLDEGIDKDDNIILTSGRTLALKVSAGFNQAEANANIKVEGLKMNPLGGCTISKTDDDLTLEVKIYGAPATPLDFSGVTNGDAFVRNGSDVELQGNNADGFFQLTDGIITKKEGDVTKTFFSPSSVASLGEKTITYVYSKGGCEFSVQKTVTVSEATSTGLTTQCKTNTEADFELPTKEDDGWLLYAVIEELGTDGNSVITKNDAKNTDAPSPVLITNTEAQALNCDNEAIKDNISKLLKLKDYGSYHYKLDPSRVSGSAITIRAVYVKLGKTLLFFDVCEDVKIFEKEPVQILPQPTKPIINPLFSAEICESKQGVYQVSSPNDTYIYEWTVEEPDNLSGTPGYTFDQDESTGTSVKINWTTIGDKKIRVTAKHKTLVACASEVSEPIDVKVKEPFKVTLEGSPIVFDGQPVAYTVKITEANGSEITDIDNKFNFKWDITNGVGASAAKSTNNVNWVLSGKTSGNVKVTVTEKNPNGKPEDDVFMCEQTANLPVTFSNLSVDAVCAETQTTYQLVNPPASSVDITWTVNNGHIGNTTPPVTTITQGSGQSIDITWSDADQGEIEVKVNDSYTRKFTVNISRKPTQIAFQESSYNYCKDGDAVVFAPLIEIGGKILAAGDIKADQLQFYGTTNATTDPDNDDKISNPFTPDEAAQASNNYQVYYVYTNGNCTYESSTVLVSTTTPKDASFGIGLAPATTIQKVDVGSQGNALLTFCSAETDEKGNIELTPTNSDGTFVIVNKATGEEVAQAVVGSSDTKAGVVFTQFNAGGIFSITYTLNEPCAVPTTQDIFVRVPTANLAVSLADASNKEQSTFCVGDNNEYIPVVKGFADASKQTGKFYIKRVSGGNNTTDFEEISKFDPSHPIPSEPKIDANTSVDERNKNAGEYEIHYKYTYNDSPCEYISGVLSIEINPLPKLTIEGLKDTYCRNESKGNIEVYNEEKGNKAQVLTKLEYKKESGDWQEVSNNNPIELGLGEYLIRATHTNTNGCTSTSKETNVEILSEPTNLNLVVTKVYHEKEMHFSASAADGVDDWSWTINGFVTDKQNASYIPNSTDENISYTLGASVGACGATIKNNFKLDFDFEGYSTQGVSKLTSKAAIGNEIIDPKWTIADKDGTVKANLTGEVANYSFATAGEYWITLTLVNQDKSVTYELKRRVDILPVITVLKTENYIEKFDNNPVGWVSRGTVITNGQPEAKTSWKMKKLANANGDVISKNEGVVWVTDNESPNNQARYYNNEQSYVETPFFDIADLDKPMVSLRYWSHTEQKRDGVVLLYTIDDGKNWVKVGKKTPEIEGWYNADGISGAPGKTSDATANSEGEGWTGTDTTWRNTSYTLSDVKNQMFIKGTDRVRFRIAFGSNPDNTADKFEGFAFDNFSISNRNRTLLLEYFTNYEASNGNDNTEELDKKTLAFPFGETTNGTNINNAEIISIHHHVGFPVIDELNLANKKDVSGRAFFHGVKEVPLAVIDGIDKRTRPHANDTSKLFYDQRVLAVSPFNITVEPATVNDKVMTVKAKVMALENFDRDVVMQVVIIEDKVESQGKTFHNVTRKMLPDAAGTYYKYTWKPGDSYDLNLLWEMGDLDIKSCRVVVFVEDYLSKEVHQAAVSEVKTLRQSEGQAGQGVTGVDQRIVKSGMLLFPNPARNEVRLILSQLQQLKSNAVWEVSTINGQTVASGVWQQRQRSLRLKVGHLAEGVYLVRVFDAGRIFLLRFKKE